MCEHHHEEETKLWQPILSGVLLAVGMAFTWMGCGWCNLFGTLQPTFPLGLA